MMTNVWIFPVAVAILIPFTFFVTYFLAVWNGHAQALLPFISDTGSFPPESCLFAQMLNVSAVLASLVMYFRHRQIVEFNRNAPKKMKRLLRCSTIFMWIGYLCAFGISMVGNFQQSNWLTGHFLGAGLAFGMGLIYSWGQTIFSYQMKQGVLYDRIIAHARLGLNVGATIACLIMIFCGFIPGLGVCGAEIKSNLTIGCGDRLMVLSGDLGHGKRLATTGGEWMLAFFFMLNLMTYAVELRHAVLEPPKLTLTGIQKSELPMDSVAVCAIPPTLDSDSPSRKDKIDKSEIEIF